MSISFAAKLISAGVILKALLMGILVSLLAVTSFEKSIILVLVSAFATGIFGIIIVIIQARAERNIHSRIDSLERQSSSIEEKTDTLVGKAETIESAITPNGEKKSE